MGSRKHSIKLAVSGVMVITLLGKLLGFLRELILAYFFGAGSVSDAYLISQTIPGTLFQIIGIAISTCFVPVYMRIKMNDSKSECDGFVDRFITLIMIVCAFMIGIVMIFASQIVKVFAMGFDRDTMQLAVVFTRISIITLFASGFVYTYTAFLQAEKKFFEAAFGVIPYNIGLMAAIIIGAKINVYALSYVSAIAVVIQLAYQVIHIRKIPYRFHFNFQLNNSYIKTALLLLPPVVVGVAATEINTLIDRTIASSIIVGGVTVITYGTSLFNLIVGVFSQSISMVYYPAISEASIINDTKKLKESVQKSVEMALFFLVPITIGVCVLATPFVEVIFGHGGFSDESVSLVSNVLIFYSIGFVPYAIKQTLNNVFYANKKTKTPMINTTIGIVVNIIGNIALSKVMGLNGLALSTSLASITIAILLIISTKREMGFIPLPSISIWLRLLASAVLMGTIIKVFMKFVTGSTLVVTFLSFVIGVVVYFAITYVLGVNLLKGWGKRGR